MCHELNYGFLDCIDQRRNEYLMDLFILIEERISNLTNQQNCRIFDCDALQLGILQKKMAQDGIPRQRDIIDSFLGHSPVSASTTLRKYHSILRKIPCEMSPIHAYIDNCPNCAEGVGPVGVSQLGSGQPK
ncbi:hypothetical protein NUU61_000294 [Penicillium alfredii]|uniref:Uncharacterized protein n=1 Tax=Penicillium alfredii TaxID=1506179 RepID=A0A9W9G9A8_9EURO|nr:uncharacterized protein NUU61_000294 [Penicillium alfredii]KAJ5114535.1 hypothetical protein NUU61_000294 [Penicillium alfredii]